MDRAEIDRLLQAHRRRWWYPLRCRCGRRRPCPGRDLALNEARRVAAIAAIEWYPVYFAQRGDGQRPAGR